jgi:quinol monooxygenase YgiN
MWAQIIKTRLKPGTDERVAELLEQLRATEQPDSGLLRTTAMRDQKDPSVLYLMVVFENEEQARARETDPRREEGLEAARAIMAEILEGSREFVDLTVIEETIW